MAKQKVIVWDLVEDLVITWTPQGGWAVWHADIADERLAAMLPQTADKLSQN